MRARKRAALRQQLDELPSAAQDVLSPFSWDDGLRDLNERMERRFAEHDRRLEALEQEVRDVKRELVQIRQELSGEIGSLRQEMTAQTRVFFLGMIVSNMTVASLAFAAARLV